VVSYEIQHMILPSTIGEASYDAWLYKAWQAKTYKGSNSKNVYLAAGAEKTYWSTELFDHLHQA
jgi:hypothetical protein